MTPTKRQQRLARAVADLAMQLLAGAPNRARIKWYAPDGVAHGRCARVPNRLEIKVASDVHGLELSKTVLHELVHLVQEPTWSDESREREAAAIEAKYGEALHRAAEVRLSDPDRVVLFAKGQRGPPFVGLGRLPLGAIVIAGDGAAWSYTPTRSWPWIRL